MLPEPQMTNACASEFKVGAHSIAPKRLFLDVGDHLSSTWIRWHALNERFMVRSLRAPCSCSLPALPTHQHQSTCRQHIPTTASPNCCFRLILCARIVLTIIGFAPRSKSFPTHSQSIELPLPQLRLERFETSIKRRSIPGTASSSIRARRRGRRNYRYLSVKQL
jgi:hypothetical protein